MCYTEAPLRQLRARSDIAAMINLNAEQKSNLL